MQYLFPDLWVDRCTYNKLVEHNQQQQTEHKITVDKQVVEMQVPFPLAKGLHLLEETNHCHVLQFLQSFAILQLQE